MSVRVRADGKVRPMSDTPLALANDIEWLWELPLPTEARRHMIQRVSTMLLSARTEERERCAQIAQTVGDEELPEPYWDNARARRMDWLCACARIGRRIRAPNDEP